MASWIDDALSMLTGSVTWIGGDSLSERTTGVIWICNDPTVSLCGLVLASVVELLQAESGVAGAGETDDTGSVDVSHARTHCGRMVSGYGRLDVLDRGASLSLCVWSLVYPARDVALGPLLLLGRFPNVPDCPEHSATL